MRLYVCENNEDICKAVPSYDRSIEAPYVIPLFTHITDTVIATASHFHAPIGVNSDDWIGDTRS